MFDMFSPKSAMITLCYFLQKAWTLCLFARLLAAKAASFFLIQYVKLIYFVCHSGSKELITFSLSCDSALNLKTQFVKMTKDVIRRWYLKAIFLSLRSSRSTGDHYSLKSDWFLRCWAASGQLISAVIVIMKPSLPFREVFFGANENEGT